MRQISTAKEVLDGEGVLLDDEKMKVSGGMMALDPSKFPTVCERCGADYNMFEDQDRLSGRHKKQMARKFWYMLAAYTVIVASVSSGVTVLVERVL